MKKNLFLSIIASVVCSITLFSAEIVERKHINSVTEYVQNNQPGLCVIFDLDNTTLHPIKDEASDEWFTARVQLFVDQGYAYLDAIAKVLPGYFEEQRKATVKPVEPEVVTLIKDLQNKGIHVIALTARSLELETCTIRQLKSIDIDFSKTCPAASQTLVFSELIHPAHYTQGIMFCSNNPKGKALLQLFEKTKFDAKKIVFVDDKLKYLECVGKELAEKGITDFIGIRYSFLDEKVKNFKLDLAKDGLAQPSKPSILGSIRAGLCQSWEYVKTLVNGLWAN